MRRQTESTMYHSLLTCTILFWLLGTAAVYLTTHKYGNGEKYQTLLGSIL